MQKTAKIVFEATNTAFETMATTIRSTKKRPEILNALKTANEVFTNSLAATASERKFSDIKKPLTAISNTVAGLIRGIEDENTSYSDTKRSIKMAEKNFAAALKQEIAKADEKDINKQRSAQAAQAVLDAEEAEISKMAASNATRTTLSGVDLHKDIDFMRGAMKVGTKVGKAAPPEQDNKPAFARRDPAADAALRDGNGNYIGKDERDTELREKFERWEALESRLPTSMNNKPFGYVKLPIVPRFESVGMQTHTNLTQFGIKHTIFGNDEDINSKSQFKPMLHVVLEDQMMLYFSKDYCERVMKQTPAEYAVDLIHELNDRQHSKYTLASEDYRTNPKKTDILMFWLLPTKVLSSMMNKQHAGSAKATPSARLKEWDFVFNRKKIVDGIRPPKAKKP